MNVLWAEAQNDKFLIRHALLAFENALAFGKVLDVDKTSLLRKVPSNIERTQAFRPGPRK